MILPAFGAIIVSGHVCMNSLLLFCVKNRRGGCLYRRPLRRVWRKLPGFLIVSPYIYNIYYIHSTRAPACKWLPQSVFLPSRVKVAKKTRRPGRWWSLWSSCSSRGKYGVTQPLCAVRLRRCVVLPLLFVVRKCRDASIAAFVLALYYFSNSRR